MSFRWNFLLYLSADLCGIQQTLITDRLYSLLQLTNLSIFVSAFIFLTFIFTFFSFILPVYFSQRGF
jgi:hypothetical protein